MGYISVLKIPGENKGSDILCFDCVMNSSTVVFYRVGLKG